MYIIDNEDAPDDYYVDPADENDYKVNIVVPEDPTQEIIVKLDDVECEVKYIEDKDSIPTIIVVENEDGDQDIIRVDTSDEHNPQVEVIQDEVTELVPTDMPEESEITDSWKPTFDQDGNVNGTTDDQSETIKPLQPAPAVIIKPVEDGQDLPSVPVDETNVVVVDGGAKKPEAVIVDNQDGKNP